MGTVNNSTEIISNIEQSKPKLPKYLTTVTTLSKILAMILFITLPFLGFYLGMRYQEQILVTTDSDNSTTTTKSPPKACTMEARQCPNGSYVSRTGPNCEFSLCPTLTPETTGIIIIPTIKTPPNKKGVTYPPPK